MEQKPKSPMDWIEQCEKLNTKCTLPVPPKFKCNHYLTAYYNLYWKQAYEQGYYDNDAVDIVHDKMITNFGEGDYYEFLFYLSNKMSEKNLPNLANSRKIEKTINIVHNYSEPQKTSKPQNLFTGWQMITLTTPTSLPHDEGEKYIQNFLNRYFLCTERKPGEKPRKPILCSYAFELGSTNNMLHCHIISYHPTFKLSKSNYPIREYEYLSQFEELTTLNRVKVDFEKYIRKGPYKGLIFINPEMEKKISELDI